MRYQITSSVTLHGVFAKSTVLTDSDNWFKSGFYGNSVCRTQRNYVNAYQCMSWIVTICCCKRPVGILHNNISYLLHTTKLQILNVDTEVQGRTKVKGTMTLGDTSFCPILYAF